MKVGVPTVTTFVVSACVITLMDTGKEIRIGDRVTKPSFSVRIAANSGAFVWRSCLPDGWRSEGGVDMCGSDAKANPKPTLPQLRNEHGAIIKLHFRATLIVVFWLLGTHAMAADGLMIVVPSSYGPKETMDRLVTEVT